MASVEALITEAGSLTVGDYLTDWLAHARGRVRPKTYEGYEGLIRLYALPRLQEIPLSALHPLHLQRVYSELLAPDRGLSTGTVLNLHLVLTQALHQAVRWGLLVTNPASGAQPPRPRRPEPRVLDAATASRILRSLSGSPLELPCALALCTGMRRGEILGLRWSDIDQGYGVAHVLRSLQVAGGVLAFCEPKTRRSRRAVALPEMLKPYLIRQRKDQASRRASAERWVEHDLVVDGGDGSPVHPDSLSAGWVRFLRRSGLPHVRFHDLRHAHATLLLLQGIHPKVVSERLGHASVGITLDIYSHVLPSMQTEAVRAFDDLFASAAES